MDRGGRCGRVGRAPSPTPAPSAVEQRPQPQDADRERPGCRRAARAASTADPRANGRRPAGSPRGRGGRRILAVLALVLIAGALYLINATFEPFHGQQPRWCADRSPRAPTSAGSARSSSRAAWSGVTQPLLAQRDPDRPPRRPAARRHLHLAARLSYGAAIDALVQGPSVEVRADGSTSALPEGRHDRRERPMRSDNGLDRGCCVPRRPGAQRSRGGAPARSACSPGARSRGGLPVPRHLRAGRGASAPRARGPASSRASADNTTQGLPRRGAKRLKLSRYDVLIIASMIEREAQLDQERPLVASVIYNRLERGHPARDRRHDPLRDGQLDAAHPAGPRLERASPYNTRPRRRLPPTPSATPASPRSGPPPRRTTTSYLY